MPRKRLILLRFAAGLVLALLVILWDPRGFLAPDLRNNLIAEDLGALVTVIFVERALDAADEERERDELAEFERALLGALDPALHALWALLVPAMERHDPLRAAPAADRIARFLRDLEDADVWANAPSAHGAAVRARIRDLGEDAGRAVILGESTVSVAVRARLDEARSGCRSIDEAWPQLPRGEIPKRFANDVVRPLRGALDALGREKKDA